MPRILLIGATGLVGRHLADLMLARGAQLHALGRRPSGRSAPNLHEHVAPASAWPAIAAATQAGVAISTLGTTIRAAGSQAAFRAVDLDMVVDFAAAARAGGARRMIAVSSVGADARSRNFYLRTKGEMEQALAGLGFERLDLVRPGLLRGDRGGERRPAERVGLLLSPVANLLLRGRLDRYAAIDAEVVGRAIASLAARKQPGRFVHHNRELRALAGAADG